MIDVRVRQHEMIQLRKSHTAQKLNDVIAAGRCARVDHHRLAVRENNEGAVAGLAVKILNGEVGGDDIHRTVAALPHDIAEAGGHFVIFTCRVTVRKMCHGECGVAVRRPSYAHTALPLRFCAAVFYLAKVIRCLERLEIDRAGSGGQLHCGKRGGLFECLGGYDLHALTERDPRKLRTAAERAAAYVARAAGDRYLFDLRKMRKRIVADVLNAVGDHDLTHLGAEG